PAGGRGGLPRRTRLGGLDGLRGGRTGRGVAGRRPAPLPDPRGPVHRGRRVRRRGTLHRPARPLPRRRPARGAARGGGPAGVAGLVDLFSGPLFRAALHLWVAASNEEQLRARVTELESRVGRETHRIAVDLLGADESRPGVRESVQGLLDMARGLGLANLLTDDTARRERVVAQWAALLDEALG